MGPVEAQAVDERDRGRKALDDSRAGKVARGQPSAQALLRARHAQVVPRPQAHLVRELWLERAIVADENHVDTAVKAAVPVDLLRR